MMGRAVNTGFSLVEIMVALVIASILSLVLYQAFSQTTRATQQIRSLIDDHAEMLLIYGQIEKDLSSVFIPPVSQDAEKKAVQADPKKDAKIVPSPQKKGEEEIKVFSSVSRNNRFEQMTFLTTHALMALDEISNRIVFVRYRLKSQEGFDEKLFTLVREELPFDPSKKGFVAEKPSNSYPLIRNITECVVTLAAYYCEENTKELVRLSEWGTEVQEKKCPKLRIPEFVEMKISIFSQITKQTTPFVLELCIPEAVCQKAQKKNEVKAGAQVAVPPLPATIKDQRPQDQRVAVVTLGKGQPT